MSEEKKAPEGVPPEAMVQSAEFELPISATHGVFIYDTEAGKPVTVPWGDANLGQMYRLLMDRLLIVQAQATGEAVMDAMYRQALSMQKEAMPDKETE